MKEPTTVQKVPVVKHRKYTYTEYLVSQAQQNKREVLEYQAKMVPVVWIKPRT